MSEIKPALSPEEWAEHLATGKIKEEPSGGYADFDWGVIVDVHYPDIGEIDETRLRHSLAARLLNGQPYGFHREDVVALNRLIASGAAHGGIGDIKSVLSVKKRIQALLPPEEKE